MTTTNRILAAWKWWAPALAAVFAAIALGPWWLPRARERFSRPANERQTAAAAGHVDDHDHDHAGHSAATSIELSPSGLKNIGYRPMTVEIGSFTKTISLPALVVERPGRSQIEITAPWTGIVTKIVPIRGAAIDEGAEMFEIRLTHEELVGAQRDLIRTAESLAVVQRELKRLKSLGEGVVAGQRILEHEYEEQKLEASLRAERQALTLHEMTEEQVEEILRSKQLLRSITVRAPEHRDASHDDACLGEHLFHVQELGIKPGQQVTAGQQMAVLGDHCQLYIEGRAFEDDAIRLRQAAREGWDISANLITGDREAEVVRGLKLLYLSDTIDPQSRAFRFYVSLPNEVVLEQETAGHRFIEWRYKPGQRMELEIPVETWPERIVVPVEAVVEEGAETYVYQQNGDHFDRVAVHVEYRDRKSVVIANDGALFPGDVIAARAAYRMHLALEYAAGGGVDPHAGHTH